MCAMPHGVAILVVIAGTFLTGFAICYMIYDNLKDFSSDPAFQKDLENYIDDMYADLNSSGFKIITLEKDGYSMDELMGYVNMFSNFINQCVLVLLLFMYILAEKVNPLVFDPRNDVLFEIEGQVQYYIALKTAISFLTGIIVDKALADWQVYGALIGPTCVQFYIGNALEPVLFGKSLNMTPLSILAALVIWSSVWGIMGAVFSVPLLSVQKICLQHTNHPMAKYCVMMIREDPTVDETAEATGGAAKPKAAVTAGNDSDE